MDWNGELKSIGFYVSRLVEAENVDDAETVGLKMLKAESVLGDDEIKKRSPHAKVAFEEIEEIECPSEGFIQPGLIFYNPEDDN